MMGAHFQQYATAALQGGGSLRVTGEFLQSSFSEAHVKPELYEGDSMSTSRGPYARNIRGSDRKMFRNVDVAAMCQKALGAAYGEEKSVHKTIAEDTGMSPSAAENWTAGENPMSLTAFLNAYHNNAAFKAWARKLLLMEAEIDPAFEAEVARFMRAAAAKLGAGQ